MAAPETGPGASSPGRASAGEEESDDEWPDVSDHEDEGDATTPIWSSSGSRPGGTSEVRPSASAAAASAAASPASEDLPAHGFHIARSASAFGPAPDETARAPPAVGDAAPASAETKNAGWVEPKTGDSLGALFGGDTPAIAVEGLETHASLAEARVGDAGNSNHAPDAATNATNATNATRATAPSPFCASALAGDDDDFFDALASPAKKTTPTRDAPPFGAPPPPNTSQTRHEPMAPMTATPTAESPRPNPNASDALGGDGDRRGVRARRGRRRRAVRVRRAGGDLDGRRRRPSARRRTAAGVRDPGLRVRGIASKRAADTDASPTDGVVFARRRDGDVHGPRRRGNNKRERRRAGAVGTGSDTDGRRDGKPDTARERRAVCPAGAGGRGTAYDAAPRFRVRRAGGGRRGGVGGGGGVRRARRVPRRLPGASRTFGYPASYARTRRMRLRVVTVHRRCAREPEPAYDHAVTPGARRARRRGGARERRGRGGVGSFPGRFPVVSESAAFAHAHDPAPPAAPPAPLAKPTFMIPAAVPAVPEASGRADAAPAPAPLAPPALPPLPPPAAPSSGYDFAPLPAAPARADAAYASYDAGAFGGSFGTTGFSGLHGGENEGDDPSSSASSFVAAASAGDASGAAGGSFRNEPAGSAGGSFSAYSASGSNFTAGDAGTPRSPHGRPPCAAELRVRGRLAVSAPLPGSLRARRSRRRARRVRAACRPPGTCASTRAERRARASRVPREMSRGPGASVPTLGVGSGPASASATRKGCEGQGEETFPPLVAQPQPFEPGAVRGVARRRRGVSGNRQRNPARLCSGACSAR